MIFLKINSIGIAIHTNNYLIIQLLNNEFSHFITEHISSTKWEIVIKNEEYNLNNIDVRKHSDSLFYSNNMVIQKLSAKNRDSYIEYQKKGDCIFTALYISYKIKQNSLERMKDPLYMMRWERCVIDFFHGPFLGIMELLLLKHGSSFLHAAAYAINGKGISLAGNGQSGKSTIVSWIVENKNISIISEDFCIVSSDKQIISYPKSSRIVKDKLDETNYWQICNQDTIVANKINLFLFSFLQKFGITAKRIMPNGEIFKNIPICMTTDYYSAIWVNREVTELKLEDITAVELAELCGESMKTELYNLSGFTDILDLLQSKYDSELCFEKIIKNIKEIYYWCFSDTISKRLNLPFYREKNETKSKINKILLEEWR